MKTHQLVQGTKEWLAHRSQYRNASDAPAMMGCSPYKTRTQLLHELHTGIAPEVDQATQRRFNEGHRIEALARPLAEKIIGEDLYPVVGSEGELSASFDGLTMAEDTGFEHKTLNDELRAAMRDEGNGYDLPLHYQVQMEQQLMVSGAERILFMATKWDGADLLEQRHCWYASDPKLRAHIVAGWSQFAQDLANYQPTETAAPAPAGKAPETLPALHIEVTGMVTASNLAAFKDHALTVFKGINRALTTDAEFADAEKTVKWCKDVEDRLKAAKEHALSQTASIDQLFKAIDDISAEARSTRLELDKLVTLRKEAIRSEIVQTGIADMQKHVQGLNTRLGKPFMPSVPADFACAVKGKRSIDSIRDAVDTELSRVKIAANAIADKIQINLNVLTEIDAEYSGLFPDIAQLVHKDGYDLTELINGRINGHKVKEAQRKEAADAAAKAVADSAVKPPPAPPAPVANVVSIPARAAAPTTPPTLKLGEIGNRLGFSLTGDFLKGLGFEPAARDKNAVLFHEADFPHICAALVKHIQDVQERQAA